MTRSAAAIAMLFTLLVSSGIMGVDNREAWADIPANVDYLYAGQIARDPSASLSSNLDHNASSTAHASGFFDWFTDLFDWFGDAEDNLRDQWSSNYSEDGITSDPYPTDRYGMNVHQLESMSTNEFARVLQYSGEWIRFNMHTDEVAEGNWGYRLEPGLAKIRAAGNMVGITPKVVINLSGYSFHSSGGEFLLRDLSWTDKANRYHNLAYSLTSKVKSLGFGDAIIEAWNEPDNPSADIGLDAGGNYLDGLATMLNGFSSGVKAAHGTTAFSPFMTLNDTKYNAARDTWNQVHAGFDYFSGHIYDDEPGKARYWAQETAKFLGGRPAIISEHGYQSHLKDFNYYRRQAWGLYQGFRDGGSNLAGIMNYVYGSDHQPWVIGYNEDFLWQVTHHGQP